MKTSGSKLPPHIPPPTFCKFLLFDDVSYIYHHKVHPTKRGASKASAMSIPVQSCNIQ